MPARFRHVTSAGYCSRAARSRKTLVTLRNLRIEGWRRTALRNLPHDALARHTLVESYGLSPSSTRPTPRSTCAVRRNHSGRDALSRWPPPFRRTASHFRHRRLAQRASTPTAGVGGQADLPGKSWLGAGIGADADSGRLEPATLPLHRAPRRRSDETARRDSVVATGYASQGCAEK